MTNVFFHTQFCYLEALMTYPAVLCVCTNNTMIFLLHVSGCRFPITVYYISRSS